MKDRIVLITGATGGIGKATALALARQGFTVVIHGRNAAKVQQVCEEIKAASGNKKTDWIVADLFLLKDARRMATEFKQKYDRLDVLINNAGGILNKERETTGEGLEKTMALNLFTPFLLTNLLLELLKKSDDGRIINVSSSSHRLNARPDFGDLQLVNNYDPLRAYGNAKLFLIWITQHLSDRMKQDGVNNIAANAMHPGAVATNFGVESNLGGVMNLIARVARRFFRSADEGAKTLIYLATADKITGSGGAYFVDERPAKKSMKYYTKEHEQMIWDYCSSVTGGV